MDAITVWTSFRDTPGTMGLFVLVPLALAVGQVLNAALFGLPVWAAAAFALAMVAYAVVFTRLHQARLRVLSLQDSIAAHDRRSYES